MLKITKESEPITVEQIVVCIYGAPGVGKTSLGFSASKPLLLDFDAGSHRAINRRDTVRVSRWNDVASITVDDLSGYDTVVVDTAGRALDALAADIIEREPKMGRGGALTLQGFGQLKSKFQAWAKLVRSFGKDVVLISHSDEQKSGDDVLERLDMQGSSKNEVYKVADAMGRLAIVNRKRALNFDPTDTTFGKNPADLDVLTVPNLATEPDFLGGVIAQIKDAMNEQTEEQQEVAGMLADWQSTIDEADGADGVNKLLPRTQKADKRIRDNVKALLMKRAKTLSLHYDKKTKAFVADEREAA